MLIEVQTKSRAFKRNALEVQKKVVWSKLGMHKDVCYQWIPFLVNTNGKFERMLKHFVFNTDAIFFLRSLVLLLTKVR